MRAVNLLPPDSYAPRRRLPDPPVVLAATAPLLAGSLVFLGYALEHRQVADREGALAAVRSSIAALGPSRELAGESAQVASERASREAALSDVLGKALPWDVVLGQIARVLPADAWLTSLTAQSPTPALATTSGASPTGLTIQGYTASQASVARLLARLALVPSLGDVALTSSLAAQVGGRRLVQFEVTASLQSPPPGGGQS